MTPIRIQRTRREKYPECGTTLTVTRPGAFGNPYKVERAPDGDGWMILRDDCLIVSGLSTKRDAVRYAVGKFTAYLERMKRVFPNTYADMLQQVREADYIACFCPVGSPCHADVWIELACGGAA